MPSLDFTQAQNLPNPKTYQTQEKDSLVMTTPSIKAEIDANALDQLFFKARTFQNFLDKPVDDELLHRLYDIMKWGPTSANQQPMRLVFVKSDEARARLLKAVAPGNAPKIKSAPVTAIVAHDIEFWRHMDRLWPLSDMTSPFRNSTAIAERSAFRNATLQGGYFLLAARAVGLDCAPMSGFSNEAVDAEFFAEKSFRSNFICGLGYGDEASVLPRLERMDFNEVAQIL